MEINEKKEYQKNQYILDCLCEKFIEEIQLICKRQQTHSNIIHACRLMYQLKHKMESFCSLAEEYKFKQEAYEKWQENSAKGGLYEY